MYVRYAAISWGFDVRWPWPLTCTTINCLSTYSCRGQRLSTRIDFSTFFFSNYESVRERVTDWRTDWRARLVMRPIGRPHKKFYWPLCNIGYSGYQVSFTSAWLRQSQWVIVIKILWSTRATVRKICTGVGRCKGRALVVILPCYGALERLLSMLLL